MNETITKKIVVGMTAILSLVICILGNVGVTIAGNASPPIMPPAYLQAMREGHNRIRQKCGVPLLQLRTPKGRQSAAAYAQLISAVYGDDPPHPITDDIHHIKGHNAYTWTPPRGENISWTMGGTGGTPLTDQNRIQAGQDGINGMAREGFQGNANHYTAMNWEGATHLDAATVPSPQGKYTYTVFQYFGRPDQPHTIPNMEYPGWKTNVPCSDPIT